MKKLNELEKENIISILKTRFEKNINRHQNINWDKVYNKLINNEEVLWSLNEMEKTGGEPDIVIEKNNEYYFYDCAKESPSERRSFCYDKEALESRKSFKPENNAVDFANAIGINILNEEEYKYLQTLGDFDLKTSSWIKTDDSIRKLGGAIFGDKRYDRTFIYHNGAESYYSSRGFRGYVKL